MSPHSWQASSIKPVSFMFCEEERKSTAGRVQCPTTAKSMNCAQNGNKFLIKVLLGSPARWDGRDTTCFIAIKSAISIVPGNLRVPCYGRLRGSSVPIVSSTSGTRNVCSKVVDPFMIKLQTQDEKSELRH